MERTIVMKVPDSVATENAGKIADFSGFELRKYVKGFMVDPGSPELIELSLVGKTDAPANVYDGFCVQWNDGSLCITAVEARGLLNGVYAILRQLGFAFPYPGLDRVPKAVDWTKLQKNGHEGKWQIPSFRHRIFHFDNMRLTKEVVDWCAKLGINMIQEPFHIYQVDIGAKAALVEEILKRGIEINVGGHGFDNWLPPKKYGKEHPEWYSTCHAARRGVFQEFDPNKIIAEATSGQLCLSNREMIKQFATDVVSFLHEHKEVSTVSLWPNDMPGGWCECENCLALEPDPKRLDPQTNSPSRSASYMWFISQVGPLIHEQVPDARIECCAFYEYASPPLNPQVVPKEDYYLGFLVDDYFGCKFHGHGQACNRPRIETDHRKWRSVFPGEIYATGYYADLCMISDVPFVFTTKIEDDFSYLKEIGVDSVSTLVVFAGIDYLMQRCFASLYSYAALAWDHKRTTEDVLRELSGAICPSSPQALMEYFSVWDAIGLRNRDVHAGWCVLQFDPPPALWEGVVRMLQIREVIDADFVDKQRRNLAAACSAAAGDDLAEKICGNMSAAFNSFSKIFAFDPAAPVDVQNRLLDEIQEAIGDRGGFPGVVQQMVDKLRKKANEG